MIDIKRANHVSSLWRYAGFSPNEKRVKGEILHFNMDLKTHCWKIAGNLLKAKGKYYELYLQYKAQYVERFQKEGRKIIKAVKRKEREGEISEGHIHNMAQRKMIKVFLQHVWITWREAEGLETNKPYAIDILHHVDYIPPLRDGKKGRLKTRIVAPTPKN
jgi:hypothetical protein